MNDKMIFGQYYHADSWIHRLDPRTKIITLFGLMITTFIFSSLWGLLGMFAVVLVLYYYLQDSDWKILAKFENDAMLLVFTVFFQIFFSQGLGLPFYLSV
jgi:energy-coupling factor transport system permease protein